MPDVKMLGEVVKGQRVNVNGHEYVVDDVREDTQASLQITLIRPGNLRSE